MSTNKCCAYCKFYYGLTGAYWAWCEKVKKCMASHECCDKYKRLRKVKGQGDA